VPFFGWASAKSDIQELDRKAETIAKLHRDCSACRFDQNGAEWNATHHLDKRERNYGDE
jgi:hypothetical protein